MAKFSDILGELAPYWARGAEQYMGEEQALAGEERAFTRRAPLRKKMKAEEIETTYGPAYSQKFLEGGLTGGLEGLKKEREAAEIAAAGGEVSQLFPGITIPGKPSGADVLREPQPFQPKTKPGLETMVKLGLERAKKPTGRGETLNPYAAAYRRVLAETGDPKQAEAAGIDAQRLSAGAQALGKGTTERGLTPIPSSGERKEMRDIQTSLSQGQEILNQYDPKWVGMFGGGILGKAKARLTGISPEEASFRANAAIWRRNLRAQYSGLAVTAPELWMNIEAIPDPEKVTSEQFFQVAKANMEDLSRKSQVFQSQFSQPQGKPLLPPTSTKGNRSYDKYGNPIKRK